MRLKKLEIIGFKSFHDKASVDFPPGISAVVGPNGCGKSNIIDALRWVMGEQSAKQLRGKSMEDVIFAGTRGKQPLNMAEVTLTLANDNGSAPVEFKDFSEISITRRQYRSGERTYLINRQPCRLKDVFNVFLGSGMGAKSYAVIQQGNIGAITDAGPEERRVFIEEAAGITRFKSRKQEALNKVQSTEQNLLRLDDILSEIQRQMGGLQRQAKKAALYRKYQARIRLLDLTLILHQHETLTEQVVETETLLAAQRDADQGHATALHQIDAAVARIKFERAGAEAKIHDQKQKCFELQRTVDRLESDLAHRREEIARLSREIEAMVAARGDIAAKNEAMLVEIQQVQSSLEAKRQKAQALQAAMEAERQASETLRRQQAETTTALEQAHGRLMELVAQEARHRNIQQTVTGNRENLQRRLRRLDEETALSSAKAEELATAEASAQIDRDQLQADLSAAAKRITSLHETLDAHNRCLAEQVREVQTIEFERGKLRTRYGALKKMEDNLEWYRDGVRTVMQAAKRDATRDGWQERIGGVLADTLTPEAPYTVATEAILGETLQYVLVPSPTEAMAAVEYLHDAKGGRCGFIPLSALQTERAPERPPHHDRLLDHVHVRPGFETAAEALLGNIYLAPDLKTAWSGKETGPTQATMVTPEGDTITAQGLMAGGGGRSVSGILAKKQELREIEARMAEQDQRLNQAQTGQKELEQNGRTHQQALQRETVAKQRLADEALQAEKTLYRIGEESRHARRHLEVLTLEQEQLRGEESDAEAQLSQCEQAVMEIAGKVRAQQQAVTRLSADGDACALQLKDFDQRIVELKLERTAVDAGLDNARQTLARLRGFHQDGCQRLDQIEQDLAAKAKQRRDAEAQIQEGGEALETYYRDLEQLAASIAAHENELKAIQDRMAVRDAEISLLQDQRTAVIEKIRILEMDLSRAQVRRDLLVQRLAENYQKDLAAATAECRQAEDQKAIKALTSEAIETELEGLRLRISAIVDVNLGAIKEYEQLKERHDFLSAQRTDLVKALDDLHKVIRKINQVTQERFTQTLVEVNDRMQEVFPRLFEGGTGRLIMTEPDNPLETGVEFLIHPPGKKLTRMSLLSGGEKAMAAIAFIFSIFMIKPASFCLLDEIDAPLDDANVLRYNDLLRLIGENSQIVMITHNKRSMEFADTLFGVTMPQKGISKIVSVNLQKTARAA
jgi:chromosome segregation protein